MEQVETLKDPKHHTERALHASACWQVWCEQQTLLRATAREAVFHGDQPIGEVTRFLHELQRSELQETYARMMLQAAMDWLVIGIDNGGDYHTHATFLWGDELVRRIRSTWQQRFNSLLAAVRESQRLAQENEERRQSAR